MQNKSKQRCFQLEKDGTFKFQARVDSGPQLHWVEGCPSKIRAAWNLPMGPYLEILSLEMKLIQTRSYWTRVDPGEKRRDTDAGKMAT